MSVPANNCSVIQETGRKIELRGYQREAVNAIYEYFQHKKGNPLIVMPTASGKSLILADFIKQTLELWSDQRIMVLTHVKELIQQDFIELTKYWPLAPAGIYSAGLKRRETQAQVCYYPFKTREKFSFCQAAFLM